ncbi:MAG: histidine kinase, partial [Gramella sp.]|nr:histidine kinase [Christiangramia sp.]
IMVSVFQEDKFLVLKVENDGALVSESHKDLMKKGVGLKNINDRLRNLYKDKYFFEIRNKKDGSGVETLIKIPE